MKDELNSYDMNGLFHNETPDSESNSQSLSFSPFLQSSSTDNLSLPHDIHIEDLHIGLNDYYNAPNTASNSAVNIEPNEAKSETSILKFNQSELYPTILKKTYHTQDAMYSPDSIPGSLFNNFNYMLYESYNILSISHTDIQSGLHNTELPCKDRLMNEITIDVHFVLHPKVRSLCVYSITPVFIRKNSTYLEFSVSVQHNKIISNQTLTGVEHSCGSYMIPLYILEPYDTQLQSFSSLITGKTDQIKLDILDVYSDLIDSKNKAEYRKIPFHLKINRDHTIHELQICINYTSDKYIEHPVRVHIVN